MKSLYLPIILLSLVFTSCNKDSKVENTPVGSILFEFAHRAGTDSLIFDNSFYTNAAGNEFRVSYLKYFISGVCLYKNEKVIFESNARPTSINGKYLEYSNKLEQNIPVGKYDSISFSMGLVPEYNSHDAFELNYNDLGMYWPIDLGGGYHFMKFEGHWKDGDDFGTFAFHLGNNDNLLTVGFPISQQIEDNITNNMTVIMDVNEWFANPYLYDLTKEDGYTMGNGPQMQILVNNGHNVFSILQ